MIEFKANGTMGDAYISVCRLYPIAKNEKVRVYHHTRHRFWHGEIERVYHVMPNIGVIYDGKFPSRLPNVDGLKIHCFPEFKFTETIASYNLPEEYAVVNIKSGRHSQKSRAIRPHAYNKIFEENKNVVIIGDEHSPPIEDDRVINLCNKTPIWAAMEIVRTAKVFYGFQGLMCFVACSQKVPTYVYVRSDDDKRAVRENIGSCDWKEYCKGVLDG